MLFQSMLVGANLGWWCSHPDSHMVSDHVLEVLKDAHGSQQKAKNAAYPLHSITSTCQHVSCVPHPLPLAHTCAYACSTHTSTTKGSFYLLVQPFTHTLWLAAQGTCFYKNNTDGATFDAWFKVGSLATKDANCYCYALNHFEGKHRLQLCV